MVKGFKMKLYEGQEAEYERRHNLLWPEMKDMIHEHGGKNYTIFLSFGPKAQIPPSTENGGIIWLISWKQTLTTAR